MKKILCLLVPAFAAATIFSSCNKKFDAPPEESADSIPVNSTIQQLKALHQSKGAYDSVTADLTISGVVTANDSSGNFYNQIVIEDNSGAIYVDIQGSDLYASYPVGRKLYIKARGLTLSDKSGCIQLGMYTGGASPTLSGIPVGIAEQYIVKGTFNNVVVPIPVTLDQLNPNDLQDPLQSELIVLSGFQFQDADLGKTYSDSAKSTYFNLQTCSSSSTIELYNSNYAYFANLPVPQGNGNITGIYTPYNTYKEIIIRDTSDVQFYGARCGAGGGVPGANITIAQLRAMYSNADMVLAANYTVSGTVISDASSKNISSGSFVLQSGNSGISVYAGGTITYNIGDSVVLNISPTDSLLNYRGSLELKLHSGAALPSPVATNVSVTPAVKTTAQIKTALALALNDPNNIEYTLVQINSATASGNSTYSGSNTLTDASGAVTLYTLTGATFASDALLTSSANWTGFAYNFNGVQEFVIRNPNDVTAGSVTPPPTGSNFTADYTFDNVTSTSGTTDPTAPPTATNVTFGSFSATGVSANSSGAGRFSFTGWALGATNGSDDFTGDIDPTKYYEVTITPNSGNTLLLSSLTFTLQRSGTGIRQMAVRSSLDGFTDNLPVTIDPANDNLSVVSSNVVQVTDAATTAQDGSTITFGSDFSAITTPVTFRFYGFNAEASTGTFSIDNVTFTGSAK